MSQENGTDTASAEVVGTTTVVLQAGTSTPAPIECESPPPAPMPERAGEIDPRARLLELAATLMRSKNRRLVVEYLRQRRAIA